MNSKVMDSFLRIDFWTKLLLLKYNPDSLKMKHKYSLTCVIVVGHYSVANVCVNISLQPEKGRWMTRFNFNETSHEGNINLPSFCDFSCWNIQINDSETPADMLIFGGDQVCDDIFVFASDLFDYTVAIVVICERLHLQIFSPTFIQTYFVVKQSLVLKL